MLRAMVWAWAWAQGLTIGDPETMIGMTAPLAEGTAAESAAAEMQSSVEAHQVPDMHLQTRPHMACSVLTSTRLVHVPSFWLKSKLHLCVFPRFNDM